MNIELGIVIAERCFEVTGHPELDVRVKIGLPQPFPDDPETKDFYCPYQITGIGSEKVRYLGGMDSLQALLLTFKTLPVVLDCLRRQYPGLNWLDLPEGQYGFNNSPPTDHESAES